MADKMAGTQNMDDLLDDLFAEAQRDTSAAPSDDFLSRVLADAEALQPVQSTVPTPVRSGGILKSLLDTIGGWQGAGGLVAATMASVWIGFSGSEALTVDSLQSMVSGDTEFYLSDLGGDFSFDFGEG